MEWENVFGSQSLRDMRDFMTHFVCVSALFFAGTMYANDELTVERAVLRITGAADVSEIPANDLETFQDLFRRPLRLNEAGRGKLLASGLFSSYQVESLLDWRSRHGDILSATELSVVDGFNVTLAESLALFLSFGAGDGKGGVAGWRHAGKGLGHAGKGLGDAGKDSVLIDVDATAGGGFKVNEGHGYSQIYGKAAVEVSGRFGEAGASLATRAPWSRPLGQPEELGWCINYTGSGRLGWLTQAVAGCFNARFGQGLLQWSGVSIESFSSPSALMKRPGGIVPYRSWSPSYAMTGVALRMDFGQLSISPYVDFGERLHMFPDGSRSELRPAGFGGNIAWNHSGGQVGASFALEQGSRGCSIDFQQTIRGVVLYGEGCIRDSEPSGEGSLKDSEPSGGGSLKESEPSALLGVSTGTLPANIGLRTAWSPYEHNITLATGYDSDDRQHSLDAGASASYFPKAKGHTPRGAAQLKARADYAFTPAGQWSCATRANVKLRALTRYSDPAAPYASSWPVARYELRQDVKWTSGGWLASLRLDGVLGGVAGSAGAEALPGGAAGAGYVGVGAAGAWAVGAGSVGAEALPGETADSESLMERIAVLGYLELGYDGTKVTTESASGNDGHASKENGVRSGVAPNRVSFAAFLQCGAFFIDDWDNRIYVYMRDAPGGYSVPAMYGRGWWLSAYSKVKFGQRYTLYFRVLYTSYPWARPTDTHKRDALEARLQLNYKF